MDKLLGILVILTLLGGAATLLWLNLQPEWWRLRHPGALELRKFTARRQVQAARTQDDLPATRAAEVRCTFCDHAPACAQRLAAGHTTPVSECPNLPRR
ncbi:MULTISPECIES: hypothetical protein [Pseudomonadota]|jgi:hypothetical protein|uniref:Uncharacterized protein n=2 Tax=Comamonadaceae TaxID=80864 RepID=A0ABQ3GD52_9BURK|nr:MULTISPECIES: hypothetical protein [Pseudomonadota]OJX31548.1 MAG: hypothetical protein BGO74_06355 [Burkholderiales bacterium 68-12]GAO20815.1 hypothetical protein ALISP_0635 [Alicycliphilus sp. B1]MCO5339742.1 hypothetical protein [Delftia tsuruhatensis]MCR4547448.1 hypothetical protein [Delftia tsuruhatensis]MDH0851322.1 hypothetical protein [Delftia tsuruhatensis]|tara:strand:- start:453 stop:749 length:297 start_codon:yes stop_codon:yes gene_type:complete